MHDLARLAPVAHKLASLLQGCHEARVSFFPATCVFGEIAHHGAFAPFAGLDAARDEELDTRPWNSLAASKLPIPHPRRIGMTRFSGSATIARQLLFLRRYIMRFG